MIVGGREAHHSAQSLQAEVTDPPHCIQKDQMANSC